MRELMIALQTERDAATGQKIPIYEQIYLAIRRDIEDGRIPCGEKLPSTRMLSANLSVSRFTVELAYEQLVSEGYVQARAGSGFFVCDLSDVFSGLTKQVQTTETQAAWQMPEAAPARIDFSPFAVDERHFPYDRWKKACREVLEQPEGLLSVNGAGGDRRLREAVATYLYRARGVSCAPEQVVVGAGSEYLLMLCAQLLGAGRAVVMEDPTYLQAYEVLTHAGCPVYAGETDAHGLRRDTLDRTSAEVIYIMPSHQFPMGTVMPLGRRQELLDWAAGASVRYILEDDHDSEFRYVGKPIPSLQSRDTADCVIYFGTFSKSISPALRMSYMVLPKHLCGRFHEMYGSYSSTVSTQQQRSVCRFMENGDFERHLNRMRRLYKAKHDFLLHELKQRPWVADIGGENAGLHLLVTVRTELTEQELLRAAAARQVKLYGLDAYRIRQAQTDALPVLLLGFGGLSQEELSEGLDILDQIIADKGEHT